MLRLSHRASARRPVRRKPLEGGSVLARRRVRSYRGGKAPGLSADARIAVRAYELYEQRGRQDGYALEDWLQAEREILRGA